MIINDWRDWIPSKVVENAISEEELAKYKEQAQEILKQYREECESREAEKQKNSHEE